MNCSKCKAPGICICSPSADPYGIRDVAASCLMTFRWRLHFNKQIQMRQIANLEKSLHMAIDRVARWDASGIPFVLWSCPDFIPKQAFTMPSPDEYEKAIDFAMWQIRAQQNYQGHMPLIGLPYGLGLF